MVLADLQSKVREVSLLRIRRVWGVLSVNDNDGRFVEICAEFGFVTGKKYINIQGFVK